MDLVLLHIQKALESGGDLATGTNDSRTFADAEVSKLIQAEDVQTFNEANGEDITLEFSASLVVLKQVTEEEIAASMNWEQDQSSELFSSTALKDAMLAPRILDRVKKLLPNSTIPLRWWQVIAVAWLWALMYGGLLADTEEFGDIVSSSEGVE
ncbi:hypothetical protein IQ07DRAFT_32769 [Pyrenochaeta sp. DS3sAY3a]|nr:hypothetical protein IQ07DRAFT_32769 [Pyrenochaeta sp. DS3sAY3a]